MSKMKQTMRGVRRAPEPRVHPTSMGTGASALAPRTREDRPVLVAEAAYFLAQARGFAPGHELEDWLAAERQIDRRSTGRA